VLKLNVWQSSQDSTSENDLEAGGTAHVKARVVMRADAVHRVILNSPVFKEMKVGTQDGEPPTGRTMFLTGMEDGKPRLFQIRVQVHPHSSDVTD
jgi:Ran-binding protein 3